MHKKLIKKILSQNITTDEISGLFYYQLSEITKNKKEQNPKVVKMSRDSFDIVIIATARNDGFIVNPDEYLKSKGNQIAMMLGYPVKIDDSLELLDFKFDCSPDILATVLETLNNN